MGRLADLEQIATNALVAADSLTGTAKTDLQTLVRVWRDGFRNKVPAELEQYQEADAEWDEYVRLHNKFKGRAPT